ncbi:putative FCP1 domain, HAD superfamily protein [Helianthus debilis subsp. tardiflorus]
MAPKVWRIKKTVIASDHQPTSDHNDKKDAGIKAVVAASGDSNNTEEQKEERKTAIDLGVSMDRLNIGSERKKKKLLVLPLRGILVYRAHRSRPETIPRNRRPDFCYGSFLVYKRPYCLGFLKFCFQRFNVGLWSSARE